MMSDEVYQNTVYNAVNIPMITTEPMINEVETRNILVSTINAL